MVVHAGRDQEVAHVVDAGKKGVCRLVACAVVLVWKLKTWVCLFSLLVGRAGNANVVCPFFSFYVCYLYFV